MQVRRLTKKPLCSIIRLHKMHNSLSNITEYDGVIRMPRGGNCMKIDLAMLWDQLNMDYPDIETPLYGSNPVRGIKLLPEDGSTKPEFLYLGTCGDSLLISCGGCSSPLRTRLSLDALFNTLQDIFNQLRDWDMETHLALIEGCEPQKLLDLTEKILKNPITLMDPSFKLLARTSHSATSSPIFNHVSQRGYLPAETVEFYRLHGYLDDLSRGKDELVCLSEGTCISVICPLRAKNVITGFLSMPCIERPYSQGVAECFRYLAEGVSLCMERQMRVNSMDHYVHSHFLIDLIERSSLSDSEIQERLRYIDLPRLGVFRLLELSCDQISGIKDYLSRKVSDLLPNERVFPFCDSILVFLPESRFAWTLNALRPFLSEHNLLCGISHTFCQLEQIRQAHNQASTALRLGSRITALRTLERLGVEGLSYEPHVFPYSRYAPYHMVEAAAEASILSPLLRRLIDLDCQGNTDHLRVLHGYLSCERRPTQTAAALHMHRNNVIYRIDRIESILDVSLDDRILRQELECSLLALELMDVREFQQNAQ